MPGDVLAIILSIKRSSANLTTDYTEHLQKQTSNNEIPFMTPDLLSAIVLLEPAEQAACLEDVLLSLAVQECGTLQIIVACNKSQVDDVRTIAKHQHMPLSMQFEAIALPSEAKDNNANRLNAALNACRGQFVTVLQTNDIVYGFAFEKLIAVLKKAAEPVAVAGTRNAYRQADGYMVTKSNQFRAGKRTFDIWFDEDCARNFVINRSKLKGNLATEPVLDYFETYFLLLALSLHNEFNFSLATESLFERRALLPEKKLPDDIEKMKLRARSKIIDWKSAQLTELKMRPEQGCPS